MKIYVQVHSFIHSVWNVYKHKLHESLTQFTLYNRHHHHRCSASYRSWSLMSFTILSRKSIFVLMLLGSSLKVKLYIKIWAIKMQGWESCEAYFELLLYFL